jgi:amino-acid N-acetyltransferase
VPFFDDEVVTNNEMEDRAMRTTESMNPHDPSTRAGWIIRAARVSDLAAVQALLSSCELSVDGVGDQFGESYAIAEHDGAAVGVAGIERHGAYGLLRSVAVAPEWRRAGIAAALVLDRLQWAEEGGVRSLYLLTTGAAAYFHRHGFRVIARDTAPEEIQASREFSQMCPSSARLMRFDGDAVVKVRES